MNVALEVARPAPDMIGRVLVRPLLFLVEGAAALLLAADLGVVAASVLSRYVFNAPLEWADDVARGLMVALSFFGAAAALAHGENMGVAFFIDRVPPRLRRPIQAVIALLTLVTAAAVAVNALTLGQLTTGQTTGSGLRLEWTFYPMGIGSACMTLFALDKFRNHRPADIVIAIVVMAALVGGWAVLDTYAPDSMPGSGTLMLAGFVLCLLGGMAIGFALALSALIYIGVEGAMPGVIFAQQMARGIDNFVLLAIPFFILVGYLMEANGMSVRLIELLERLVGLNVVMVLAMVLFSGISGSKMADVAAVGSVLIPAARRTRQNPGNAVALLAASAVMAETIPPCINLIILGFVANISIGGLFMAGLLPAAGADRRRGDLRRARAWPGDRHRGGDAAGQAMGRGDGYHRPDRHHLRRLQIRLCDSDRDFRLRRHLCAGGGRHGVPRAGTTRGHAQLRRGGEPLRPRAVHRRRRAIAGLRADPATGASRAGRDADRAVA